MIEGRAYVITYNASNRIVTRVSPAGRRTSVALDARDLPTMTHIGVLEAVTFSYDSHGRIAAVAQGPASNRRTATYSYSSDGWLAAATDALGQVTSSRLMPMVA
jgi:YD repeat-containing protein